MLHQVLHEITNASGPITLNELSRKLGVTPSALQGMIDFWVRKGRLKNDDVEMETAVTCGSGCGSDCAGRSSCHFVAKMPKTYSLPSK